MATPETTVRDIALEQPASIRVRECTWTTDRTSAQKMLNERLVQISRGELFETGKRVSVAAANWRALRDGFSSL